MTEVHLDDYYYYKRLPRRPERKLHSWKSMVVMGEQEPKSITKDEADMLLSYYAGSPDELADLKKGLTPKALRYIEALELSLQFAETDHSALTDEEDERLRDMAREYARRWQ